MIASAFLLAQIVASTPRGPVIAHDGRIELHRGWSAPGVEHATAIVGDALNNEAVIADLATGKTTRMQTAETPVGGAFVGDQLRVLARDEGDFIRESNGILYIYSRMKGTLSEVGSDRKVQVAPFASDFEIGGRSGYLVFPREAKIRTVDLASMKTTGAVSVGAVPVDLAFAGGGTAITARVLAVADPSAKRVWLTEGTQSTMQAVARGFLRGFLGLGLFGNRSSQFPTGVDRVLIRGKQWIAYDSSSATLYRFTKSKSSVIAKGVGPQAFAVTAEGVVYWKNGTLVAESKE